MAGFTKTRIVDPTGGGTDTTIAGAVSNVSSGGTVIVEEYNSTSTGYEISSAIAVPSDVTIIGRGNVLITIRSDTPAFSANSNSRIVISGFRIKADRSNQKFYSSQVIQFQNTKNCIIEKCAISVLRPDVGSAGIYFSGPGGDPPVYAEGNVITECVISGDGTNNGPVYGIHFYQYCARNMITHNTVFGCNENCAIISHSEQNTIMGNVFRNSNSNGNFGGLYLRESDNNALIGNECYDNEKMGIYLRSSSGCTVQGNTCKDNTQQGINVCGDSTTSSLYNSIVNNVAYGNSGAGILLAQYAGYNSVSGNSSSGNAPTGIAEESTNVDYNAIVGNVCNDNASVNIVKNGAHSIEAGNIS